MRIELAMLVILIASFAVADDQPGVQRTAKLNAQVQVQMNYLLYLPKDYNSQDSWPLVLFLHGSGERGDDLELVKKHGPPKLIAEGKIAATGMQFPKEMARKAAESADEWLKGGRSRKSRGPEDRGRSRGSGDRAPGSVLPRSSLLKTERFLPL